MSFCKGCWWADFNESAPGKHNIHEEPDYLRMKNPFGDPPMVRIIQTCAKGKVYFKTYGAEGEHDCKAFTPYEAENVKEEARVKRARKNWKGISNREKLPATTNALALIEVMYEGDNAAYDVLTGLMMLGEAEFSKAVVNANDMNIRGTQLASAAGLYGYDADDLCDALEKRSMELVKFLNNNVHLRSMGEKAVERGAATYAHKKRTTVKKIKRKEVEVVDTGRTAKRKIKLKR